MDIVNLLRILLVETGQTQEQLARALGVSRQALSTWLNGSSVPHAAKLKQVRVYYLEMVGRDTVSSELLADTITDANKCHLTAQELLGSTPTLNTLIVQMTYHTNSIEGSTMTAADNEAVLLSDRVLPNRSAREQLEARNHRAALLWLLDHIEDGNFTWNEKLAQDLHIRLMNGLVIEAGTYRNHGVRILGSHVTVANYVKVPLLMEQLFKADMPQTFEQMARFHADFEQIHPFGDGNGRVGRLLLAATALMQGLTPPIVERERRSAYYHSLALAQMQHKPEPLTYLLADEVVAAHKKLGL